jgi:hypothetical protein
MRDELTALMVNKSGFTGFPLDPWNARMCAANHIPQ